MKFIVLFFLYFPTFFLLSLALLAKIFNYDSKNLSTGIILYGVIAFSFISSFLIAFKQSKFKGRSAFTIGEFKAFTSLSKTKVKRTAKTKSWNDYNFKGDLLPFEDKFHDVLVRHSKDGKPRWLKVEDGVTIYKSDGLVQVFYPNLEKSKKVIFRGKKVDVYFKK